MRIEKKSLRKLAVLGILAAMCSLIGYLESLMPAIFPFLPFAKIGLSNIVILFTMIVYSPLEGFLVLGPKCIIVGLLSGNPMMILYSVAGGVLSMLAMFGLLKCKLFSLPAVSSVGGFTHCFGQICVACLLSGSSAPFYYLPHLGIFGAIAGIITGLLVYLVVKKLPMTLIYKGEDKE